MAKKSVKLMSSIIILGTLIGSYYGLKMYVDKIEEEENLKQEETTNVFSCNYDDVRKISFLSNGEELIFEKEEEQWIYTEDVEFPVKQSEIEASIGIISELDAETMIEDVEDTNVYELGNPTNVLMIETSDGKQTTLTFGMKNTLTDQYYLMLDENPEIIYVVDSLYAEAFEKGLYDFADGNEFPNIDTSLIEKVEVQKGELDSYSLNCDQSSGLWYVSSEEYKGEKADSSYAQNVISSIGSLEYKTFVDYHCQNDAEYGLDDPYATIVMEYQEDAAAETQEIEDKEKSTENAIDSMEESEVFEKTGVLDKNITLLIGDETGDFSRYVKIEGETEIYTMSDNIIEIFTEKNADYFLDLTVNYVALNEVEKLTVEYDSELYVIDVSRETLTNESGEEETDIEYYLNDEKLDSTEFTTFYNKVINMVGESRLKTVYESEENAIFCVIFEKSSGKSEKILYYEYDTDFYAVVVNGKAYLVKGKDVNELIECFMKMIEE